MDATRRGKLTGLVVLPEGFGKTAGVFWVEGEPIQVGVDPSRKAEAAMIQGMIMKVMGELIFTRMQDPASYRPLVKGTAGRNLKRRIDLARFSRSC